MKLTVMLLAALLVTGCAQNGPAAIDPALDCAGWKPIMLRETTVDALDDREVKAILGHNEFGQSKGCW